MITSTKKAAVNLHNRFTAALLPKKEIENRISSLEKTIETKKFEIFLLNLLTQTFILHIIKTIVLIHMFQNN